MYSYKFRKFHRKTPVLESLFNKLAGLKVCNIIKNWLQRRFFLVKFAKLLRTTILKNICQRFFLEICKFYWKHHSMHWGIDRSQKHPLFFVKPSLKTANRPSPSFLGNSPLYIGLSRNPLKIVFFSKTPWY